MSSTKVSRRLRKWGVRPDQQLMLHVSFRTFRQSFPGTNIETLIHSIQEILGGGGSLILPTFTYSFQRRDGKVEPFDVRLSPAKTGAVAEVFRHMPTVTRTASPTHSFALWGKAAVEIDALNSPDSPLGRDSVLAWLAHQPQGAILLLGVNFSALSLVHFLEVATPAPWADLSPWDHLGIEKCGVSVEREQPLIEIPGCSRGFVGFQKHLEKKGVISEAQNQEGGALLLPVKILYNEGMTLIREKPEALLCLSGSCPACDERRRKLGWK